MSSGVADALEDLSWRGDDSENHKCISLGGKLDELAVLDSSSTNDMRAELDKKEAVIDALVNLLEKIDASVDEVTDITVKLMDDNAAWKKLLEEKSASEGRLDVTAPNRCSIRYPFYSAIAVWLIWLSHSTSHRSHNPHCIGTPVPSFFKICIHH